MKTIKIALAQINPIVGDLTYNLKKIFHSIKTAQGHNASIVLFPELCLCGYPPEDLLFKRSFLEDNLKALEFLKGKVGGIMAILGMPLARGEKIYNSAVIIRDGDIAGVYNKIELPNYGVFDEKRYFSSGDSLEAFDMGGIRLCITICEDIWVEGGKAIDYVMTHRPNIILNLSASPFHKGKMGHRLEVCRRVAGQIGAPIAYCNLVGGQDELVFDGGSLAYSPISGLVAEGPRFREAIIVMEMDLTTGHINAIKECKVTHGGMIYDKDTVTEEVFMALVLGTRDYVEKNGFKEAVLGVSGGIDSALTACIAKEALGQENLVGVTMPSMYTSKETYSDAKALIQNLGIRHMDIPIEPIYGAYVRSLEKYLGVDKGVAYENLQARIRGNILMALSNQHNWIVLTTGNKSETATGYCTLYGDTAGGFAVLKDVPKYMVYELAKYYNRICEREVIPRSIMERPPTAELRPNQRDEDTLPPYAILDPILEAYAERDLSPAEITDMGLPKEMVERTIRLIEQSEFKRRQTPPGPKITPRGFGKDRRLPITNHYRGAWDPAGLELKEGTLF